MRKLLPYILLIPTFVIIVMFIYFPAGTAFKMSFYKTSPFGNRMIYVGFRNFIQLFQNPDYLYSVRFTLIYVSFSVTITIFLAFILAFMLTRGVPGTRLYRTFLFAPYAVSPAIAGTLWTFLLNPVVGHVNYFFMQLFGVQVEWLTSKPYAFYALIFATVWKMLPFNMIFYIASIQDVSTDLVEAATLDGAGTMTKVWKIVFPLVSPITFYLVIMNIVMTMFSSFAIVDVMTRGGPGGYTTNMIYRLYLDAFAFQKRGPASAQSIVMFMIMIVITILYFNFAERRVHYQ
ncbi:carbohydrate ABC transporter permease [Kosmotoga pacifica]|uniref:Glycerol-3-phosphate ABC transporter permease n=1 Tax=Kosmotoga pacifica TaxID=1330330 RepID=A0A0G2ZBS4_9BACT|nr:sugar ABC transporter permease [Kosmotoga pacifica]AKI97526.1 glycerol-3-phosphate ABC transporter permease [Kosmotoga pacifica]